MPFHAADGSDDVVFMNRADQVLYLVPLHIAPVFHAHNESNSRSDDPLVVCRYHLPGTKFEWYAVEFRKDTFRGFVVTGTNRPEWRKFSINQFDELAKLYSHNVLRDENFEPKLFSEAIPAELRDGQNSHELVASTRNATAELLDSSESE